MARTPKLSKSQKEKVEQVMHEYKEGELTIGRSDKKVKSRKQAVAIALNEAGASRPPKTEQGKSARNHGHQGK